MTGREKKLGILLLGLFGLGSGEAVAAGPTKVLSCQTITLLGAGIVRGNTAIYNGADGIQGGYIITGNFVGFNGVNGILGGSGTILAGNAAIGNGSNGIGDNNESSLVTGNTAAENGVYGLAVGCPGNVIGNTAVANSVTNLVLSGGGCNNSNNVAP